ncbi:MAG: DUF3330 domain-containing protein [Gammaproteobacteria bacterium]|nr:DUF3330 domain-containing protein [Gammaproteobacteria bacterium]
MTDEGTRPDQQDDELISCDICMKTIPRSASKSVEVDDYVAHFCGLDCYQSWLDKDDEEADADSPG